MKNHVSQLIMNLIKGTGFVFICLLLSGSALNAQEELYLKGVAELNKGKNIQAVESFSQILSEKSGKVQIWLKRGEAYLEMKDYDRAIQDFNMANSIEPSIASLWLSRCFALTGEPEKAVRALENHLRSVYKKSQKEILLDPAFLNLEKTREWRNLWKTDWYKPYEYQKSEAAYQIQKDNYTKALENINILLNQNEEDASLYYLRAQVYLALKQYSKSLSDLERAINMETEKENFRLDRAELYITMGHNNEALQDYSYILDRQPEFFDLYIKRAKLLLSMQKYDQALSDIEFYLGYFNEDIEAQYLGGMINYSAGRYFDALVYFNNTLEIGQDDKKYFIDRGNTFLKLHTYKYAVNDFSMALDLDPQDSGVYLNRGIAHIRDNKSMKACYDFKKAFGMGEREALFYLQQYCNY